MVNANSAGQTNQIGQAWGGTYTPPQPQHVCPACGYCPCCGRQTIQPHYTQPIWYWNPNTAPFYSSTTTNTLNDGHTVSVFNSLTNVAAVN